MLFEKDHRANADTKIRRAYAIYEIVYTLVDFGAAVLFVIGSIMFFFDAWVTFGTWLFLIGSLLFATKPTIRLVRDIRLATHDGEQELADRYEG